MDTSPPFEVNGCSCCSPCYSDCWLELSGGLDTQNALLWNTNLRIFQSSSDAVPMQLCMARMTCAWDTHDKRKQDAHDTHTSPTALTTALANFLLLCRQVLLENGGTYVALFWHLLSVDIWFSGFTRILFVRCCSWLQLPPPYFLKKLGISWKRVHQWPYSFK